MKRLFNTLAAASLGIALTAVSANAAPIVFTVDEGAVLGAINNEFDADKIASTYVESVTFSGNTFTADLVVTFNGYTLNGNPVAFHQVGTGEPLNEVFNPEEYGLYALVTVTGEFESAPDPNDPQILFDFDPLTASANVYLDPDQDGTETGAPDELIMTATLIDVPNSDGTVTTDLAGNVLVGEFTLAFTNATTQGTGDFYWPDFAGLVLRATATGDIDDTSTLVAGQGGEITGEASINFEVAPEPASMTLFGLALFGAGLAARRRRTE